MGRTAIARPIVSDPVGTRRASRVSRSGLRILIYGNPPSEALVRLAQRCRDGTVVLTDDRRVLDAKWLARFSPHVVMCDVPGLVDVRSTIDPTRREFAKDGAQPRLTEARQRPPLTEREAHVVEFAGKGFHNDEIARLLNLHPRTVKNVLSQLYLKFDVTNRTELVGSLFEQCLIRHLPER